MSKMREVMLSYLLSQDDLNRFDAGVKSSGAEVGWLPAHTPPGQGGHR